MTKAQYSALQKLYETAGADAILAALADLEAGKGMPAPVSTKAPDYRTAAEIWTAGGVIKRAKRSKGAIARSVAVTLGDGRQYYATTYLDGQPGLNEAAAFARTACQPAAEDMRWIKDGAGSWRLINPAPAPDAIAAYYVGG